MTCLSFCALTIALLCFARHAGHEFGRLVFSIAACPTLALALAAAPWGEVL